MKLCILHHFSPLHPLVILSLPCRLALLWNAFICDRLWCLTDWSQLCQCSADRGWIFPNVFPVLNIFHNFTLQYAPVSCGAGGYIHYDIASLAPSHTSCQSNCNCISSLPTQPTVLLYSGNWENLQALMNHATKRSSLQKIIPSRERHRHSHSSSRIFIQTQSNMKTKQSSHHTFLG